ncbi:III C31 subunit of DNA-directed RNA polymerase [Penicillium verhagenii]|uniref:III C31 subunit of DNA-directed RNA polymerase n=1 Tax=Penicillium verhagenii TaxID=1562060 RepID=UPI0025459ECA|nr:III C31 subunit of DNA-directed RNA polymerase [Penicillium verhagenii]KAJ5921259.1 III C31 subunit of DNA-directed RNA polymerase [Penicillium verhagenii]
MLQNLTEYTQAFTVPWARKLSAKEQNEVDHYRTLRERDQEGPHYSVLDSSSSSAKKGSAARVNFDPFTGMPSYSGRYQKKRRMLPQIEPTGRPYEYIMKYFPRELWQTIQPTFRPDVDLDGYKPMAGSSGMKRGFEDDEDDGDDDTKKKREAGDGDEEGDGEGEEGDLLDEEEGQEEWEEENDFEDDEDEMGGDYNAEQYFDGGDDDYGDDDGGDGGGEDVL